MRDLSGKVAFVTGGASGIGLALGRALGRTSMRVMLADIEAGALEAAVTELKGLGIEVRGIECRRGRRVCSASGNSNLRRIW
jgi:NAD(P)-dependent dehydrogenase (short-subunit alcohol dehydrogenase family)